MATEDLVKALTVPFVAGLIVQRLLEIVDPITVKFVKDPNTKKIVLGFVSLGIGSALCGFGHVRIFEVLHPLFPNSREMTPFWDVVFSGIFISAGTEGFNSLMKFANYKKESTKTEAAAKKAQLSAAQLRSVNP
jgi:hypothetical protein